MTKNVGNAFVSGYKTYATFGLSDYSKGNVPYQGAVDAATAPPEMPGAPAPVLPAESTRLPATAEELKAERIKSEVAGQDFASANSGFFQLRAANSQRAAASRLLG